MYGIFLSNTTINEGKKARGLGRQAAGQMEGRNLTPIWIGWGGQDLSAILKVEVIVIELDCSQSCVIRKTKKDYLNRIFDWPMTETTSLDFTKDKRVMFVLYFDHTLFNKPTISTSALSAFSPDWHCLKNVFQSNLIQQVYCQYTIQAFKARHTVHC